MKDPQPGYSPVFYTAFFFYDVGFHELDGGGAQLNLSDVRGVEEERIGIDMHFYP